MRAAFGARLFTKNSPHPTMFNDALEVSLRLRSLAILGTLMAIITPALAQTPAVRVIEGWSIGYRRVTDRISECVVSSPGPTILQMFFSSEDKIRLSLTNADWRLGPDVRGTINLRVGPHSSNLEMVRSSENMVESRLLSERDVSGELRQVVEVVLGNREKLAVPLIVTMPNGSTYRISIISGTTDAMTYAISDCGDLLREDQRKAAERDPFRPR